jgi:lipopolysaccharide exporter
MSALGNQMARSAGWMIGMRLADRVIGFVSLLVLARLLVPADFGLVAMATSIVALLDALTAFGFEWAVIQRQSNDRRHLDTAWTLNLVIGAINGLLVLALIPLLTWFYNEPRLAPLALLLAGSIFLGGLRNVGMIQFERDLAFGRVFALTMIRRLTGFGVTLTIALMYRSYWALVIGSFAGVLADLVMSYVLSAYRPRLALSGWRDIMSFSRWFYVSNVLNFVNGRGTHLIIGRISGAGTLGTFNIAYELGALPTSEIVLPAFRAMFPGYAKLREDPAELASMVGAVIALTMLAVAPAAIGIVVLAGPIVDVLLGEKWLAVVPLLQVFGLIGAVHAFGAPINAVNLAIGRADLPAKLGGLNAVISLPVFAYMLAHYGVVAAAVSLLAVGALIAGLAMAITARLIGFKPLRLVGEVWRPIVASAVMGVAVALLADATWHTLPARWGGMFAALLALVASGVVIYMVVMAALWLACGQPAGAEARVLSTLASLRLKKKGSPLVGGA